MCLEVDGLTCGSCVAKAERALLSVDGVLEVRGTHTLYLWGTCTLQSATRPLASSTWWFAELYGYVRGNAQRQNAVTLPRG